MNSEVTTVVRIALYFLAGWLGGKGVPAPVIDIITTDPNIAPIVSDAIAGAVGVGAIGWWRVAKKFGWAT